MTAEALKKILWLYMHDSTDLEYIMGCINDYAASQQPLAQAAQPPAAEAVAGQIKPFKPIKGKLYVHYPSFTEDNSKLIDAECIGIVGEIGHFQCYDIHGEKWENIQTANIRLFTTTQTKGGTREDEIVFVIGEEFTIEDLPSGSLFMYGPTKTIAMKSEYRNEKGACECYILESGEIFWAGVKEDQDLNKLKVTSIHPK